MAKKLGAADATKGGESIGGISRARTEDQFCTLSPESRRKFDAVVSREGLLRSMLLRNWVDDFIACRDAQLPVCVYDAPWPGMSARPPSEKIRFLVTEAARIGLRARAKSVGVEQTMLIRAWIEAFCAKRPKGAAALPARAVVGLADKSFKFMAPASLKSQFETLCGAEGRHSSRVLEGWICELAEGRVAELPPIDDALAKHPLGNSLAADEPGAYIMLTLPSETLAAAMAASRLQGRYLKKTLCLWIATCVWLGKCSGFAGKAKAGKRRGVKGADGMPASPMRSAAAPRAPGEGADSYFTAPVTAELKKQFDDKCRSEGKSSGMLLRVWLLAYKDGDASILPNPVDDFDEIEVVERGKWGTQARSWMARVDLDLIKAKAKSDGISMSKLARGWIRGYLG